MDHRPDLVFQLQQPTERKILFVIADGLGGIRGDGPGTELEMARTPNLDRLARDGVTGLLVPVAPGITPGSGPGHLALFGYDPVENDIGRGVLTALGVDFDLTEGDVAARGNFCTIDSEGVVVDRRAGRISSETGARLAEKLQQIEIDGATIFVRPVEEHRFLLVIRGEGFGSGLEDTDPQTTGAPPRQPQPIDDASRKTAEIVAAFVERARRVLADEPANMVLLRGFEQRPDLPSMKDRYGLRACAVAGYPMYRGIGRLLGMHVAESESDLDSEVDALQSVWHDHDFFFFHYKATDSAGEDGNFGEKVRAIEELDRRLPRILDLRPEVLVVTGDHSTPSQMSSHSWHPVPMLLSARTCRQDDVQTFGETACTRGGLSQMPTKHLMAVALAHAGRLRKYGA